MTQEEQNILEQKKEIAYANTYGKGINPLFVPDLIRNTEEAIHSYNPINSEIGHPEIDNLRIALKNLKYF